MGRDIHSREELSAYSTGDVVMVRGMLRAVFLAVATLALLVVIYLLTLPASAHPRAFIFSDLESDAVDLSYGVIIDAGSTGSRLFLYKWKVVSDTRLIDMHPALDEFNRAVVKKANPGLSTFANNPENATERSYHYSSSRWEVGEIIKADDHIHYTKSSEINSVPSEPLEDLTDLVVEVIRQQLEVVNPQAGAEDNLKSLDA